MAYREPDTIKIIDCMIRLYKYEIDHFTDSILELFLKINSYYDKIYVEYQTQAGDFNPFIIEYLNNSSIRFHEFNPILEVAQSYVEILVSIAF